MSWLTRLLSSDNPLSSRRFQAVLAVLTSLGLCIFDALKNDGLTVYSTGLLGALSGVALGSVALAKPAPPSPTDEGS